MGARPVAVCVGMGAEWRDSDRTSTEPSRSCPRPTDNKDMTFELCPYCQASIEGTYFPGGWLRIDCGACGAQWEVHGGMVRRIADGDLIGAGDETPEDRRRRADVSSGDGVSSTS